MKKIVFSLYLGVLLLMSGNAYAVLKIEITKGDEGALPIAVVPFGWKAPGSVLQRIDEIIAADLHRSGYFSPIAKEDFLSWPTEGSQIRCKDWRMLAAENVVVGGVRAVGDVFEVKYELYDVLRCKRVEGFSFRVKAPQLRLLAHQISDQIYKALTGVRGAFATRIAYVVVNKNSTGKRQYQLQVADSDGFNPKTILTSKESIISVAWSPDGTKLAYASFENGPVMVYVQNLETGGRTRLLDTKDQVSGPAWSPDGKKLAVVISKRGKRDIYIVNPETKQTKRLTRVMGSSFYTEPAWDPDGKSIIFTSFLGGRPQLYRQPLGGGRPERLTFEGKYNTKGTFSPDGKLLGMVHSNGAGYHIAVLELETGTFRVLTQTQLDESPSFAPNGSMILYATRDRDRGVLSAVSADGRVGQRFALQEGGDAREAAWGPFLTP